MASPGDWYATLPPVSKFWGTACVLTTVGVQCGLLDVGSLYLAGTCTAVFISLPFRLNVYRLIPNLGSGSLRRFVP
jgi:hypothetical protein